MKEVLLNMLWKPFFAVFRRFINWIARQFVYIGASSLHKVSNLFVPSSPLNSRRCRKESRKDLVDNYGALEFWLPSAERVLINGVYLSVRLFKEHQLPLTSDKEELSKLQSLGNDGETVILFLGNNEYFEEEESKFRAKWYLLQGKNVLMFNYPGYGDSKGKPSHRTTDAASHLIYSLIRQGFWKDKEGNTLLELSSQAKSDKQIILHGYSLGGGIASRLVGQLRGEQNSTPRLLLDRTFDNIYTIALQFIPEFLRGSTIVKRALKEVIEENYNYRSVEFLKQHDKENLFVIHADFDELMFENTKRSLNRVVETSGEDKGATVVNVKKRHGTEWEEVVRHIRRNNQEKNEDLEVFLRLMNRSPIPLEAEKGAEEVSWIDRVKTSLVKVFSFFKEN
jgi:hypothetical protein